MSVYNEESTLFDDMQNHKKKQIYKKIRNGGFKWLKTEKKTPVYVEDSFSETCSAISSGVITFFLMLITTDISADLPQFLY